MTAVRFGASSIGCIIAITAMALPAGGQTSNPLAKEYLQVTGEIDQHLQRDVIGAWFPRCIDQENGGQPTISLNSIRNLYDHLCFATALDR